MTKLFVLIRRKGTKRFLGAIPTRKGATVRSLRRTIPPNIKKSFSFKIVTDKQLKLIILKQRPRRRLKRLRLKRRIRRKRRSRMR